MVHPYCPRCASTLLQGIAVDDERIVEPGIESASLVSTQDDETQSTNAPRNSYWESDTADVYRRNVRALAEYYIFLKETRLGNTSRTVLSRAIWGKPGSSETSQSLKNLNDHVNQVLQDNLVPKERYLKVEFSLVSKPCPQGEVLLMVDEYKQQGYDGNGGCVYA